LRDFSGNQLPGLPKQFGYLGLTYNSERGLSGTIEAIYSGDLYANNANSARVSSYTIANLRLAYEFTKTGGCIGPTLASTICRTKTTTAIFESMRLVAGISSQRHQEIFTPES